MIAFDTFRQVEYVARAYWFHAQDVPEAELHYGLTEGSGVKKPSFTVYQDVAAYDSPTDLADDPAPGNRPMGPTVRHPGVGSGAPQVPPQSLPKGPPVFKPHPDAASPRTTTGGRP